MLLVLLRTLRIIFPLIASCFLESYKQVESIVYFK